MENKPYGFGKNVDQMQKECIADLMLDMKGSGLDMAHFTGALLKIADGVTSYPNNPRMFVFEADIIEAAILDGGIPEKAEKMLEPIRTVPEFL